MFRYYDHILLILKQNADDLEEFEEDGEGRIQVRTIVVGEGEGARIECLSCHRIMKPNSLKAHLKTHAHERPHACDLCDARFTRRGDLERHIKVVHNKDRPFKCSKCHRTFGDKKNLRWHLSNHDRKLFHHCQVSINSTSYKEIIVIIIQLLFKRTKCHCCISCIFII